MRRRARLFRRRIELADPLFVEPRQPVGIGDRAAVIPPGELVLAQQVAVLMGVQRVGIGLAQVALQLLQARRPQELGYREPAPGWRQP